MLSCAINKPMELLQHQPWQLAELVKKKVFPAARAVPSKGNYLCRNLKGISPVETAVLGSFLCTKRFGDKIRKFIYPVVVLG